MASRFGFASLIPLGLEVISVVLSVLAPRREGLDAFIKRVN
jgi:hypothetical protein